jgi:hypothetical protein
MINSVSGSITGGWWSIAQVLLVNGLKSLKPEADFIPFLLTSNDGKTMGAPDNGLITNTYSITTQSRNPEKVMSFLDFLNTDEGWKLASRGIEGVDYNMTDGFPIWNESGTTKYNNKTLDPLDRFVNRIDLRRYLVTSPLTEWTQLLLQKWEILQYNNNQPSYTSAFYGLLAPRANDEYGIDVGNWTEQSAMAFITGETPLDKTNWNNYINTWKRMGGVKILQGYIDTYNTLNGTRITAGITE